jgi:hypothetical protein
LVKSINGLFDRQNKEKYPCFWHFEQHLPAVGGKGRDDRQGHREKPGSPMQLQL